MPGSSFGTGVEVNFSTVVKVRFLDGGRGWVWGPGWVGFLDGIRFGFGTEVSVRFRDRVRIMFWDWGRVRVSGL